MHKETCCPYRKFNLGKGAHHELLRDILDKKKLRQVGGVLESVATVEAIESVEQSDRLENGVSILTLRPGISVKAALGNTLVKRKKHGLTDLSAQESEI